MNTAISIYFLLWTLIFCCPDPGWTTQAEEMASLEVKMTNIMDRMTRMEAEMIAKDERIAVLEAEREANYQRFTVLEDAMETKDQRIAVLEDQVRNQPFAFQCAWRNGFWTEANSVVRSGQDHLKHLNADPDFRHILFGAI